MSLADPAARVMLPPAEVWSPVANPEDNRMSPPSELEEPGRRRMDPGFIPSIEFEVEMSMFPLLLVLDDPVSKDKSPLL